MGAKLSDMDDARWLVTCILVAVLGIVVGFAVAAIEHGAPERHSRTIHRTINAPAGCRVVITGHLTEVVCP